MCRQINVSMEELIDPYKVVISELIFDLIAEVVGWCDGAG